MKDYPKTQAEWNSGKWSIWELWEAGFEPKSNKYRSAVKAWKDHGKYYSVDLTLTQDEYNELKDCPSRARALEHETEWQQSQAGCPWNDGNDCEPIDKPCHEAGCPFVYWLERRKQ